MLVLQAAAVVLLLVSGCMTGPPETTTEHPAAQRLVGKTRTDLLQCAGTPLHEVPYGHGVIFRYYMEAPMFEESRPFLKGSIAQEHHGCWASLLLEKDEVTGVEFRTVPESRQYDHCEQIFMRCLQ
jgi:hypothetical protein